MAQGSVRICLACTRRFEGRSDAKTCSARCRKRLQRARAFYATDNYDWRQRTSKNIDRLAVSHFKSEGEKHARA